MKYVYTPANYKLFRFELENRNGNSRKKFLKVLFYCRVYLKRFFANLKITLINLSLLNESKPLFHLFKES